jgi:hypothetical protein
MFLVGSIGKMPPSSLRGTNLVNCWLPKLKISEQTHIHTTLTSCKQASKYSVVPTPGVLWIGTDLAIKLTSEEGPAPITSIESHPPSPPPHHTFCSKFHKSGTTTTLRIIFLPHFEATIWERDSLSPLWFLAPIMVPPVSMGNFNTEKIV